MRAGVVGDSVSRRLAVAVDVGGGIVIGSDSCRFAVLELSRATAIRDLRRAMIDGALAAASMRLLDRLGQPRRGSGAGLEPVDDDLDVVLDLAVELQVVGQPDDLAVDAGPQEARFSRSANRSLYSPFWPRTTGASTRNRVPSGRARMRAMICSRRLGRDGRAALRAMPLADAGEEDAQVVVDLGDRADGLRGFLPAVFCWIEIEGASPAI